MKTSSGYRIGFTCDHCGDVHGTESAYHCKQCEYDLCVECSIFSGVVSGSEEEVEKEDGSGTVKPGGADKTATV